MIFGLVKPSLDAHTLGINSVADIIKSCGYEVFVAPTEVSDILDVIGKQNNWEIFRSWIFHNKISNFGFSYRLDIDSAVNVFGKLFFEMKSKRIMSYQGGPITNVYFAGLPKACSIISDEYKGEVKVFEGSETPLEVVSILGIPNNFIPDDFKQGSLYDESRMSFAKKIIKDGRYLDQKERNIYDYPEYGTDKDRVVLRLKWMERNGGLPLTRSHMGPYFAGDRGESLRLFLEWTKDIAKKGSLDILSIGTSQLSQSNFGEDWGNRPNGGGVPINSEAEYRAVWSVARPMLVRTYAGTRNILKLASLYEETLNMAWHALSFWWFCRTDGRGDNSIYNNLVEHLDTLAYIAKTGKPFEPNIPHHFSFRGSDDVTYIVSAYLAAKVAKLKGIKYLILQNMLNTPKYTWGVQDLAKSRAMLYVVRKLEDKNFKVILQPRAGLDYFVPDQNKAKIQLGSVATLMDDIEAYNFNSPGIIHVVGYSEGTDLATPSIIDESIKITIHTLKEYRKAKQLGETFNVIDSEDINERTRTLIKDAETVLSGIENNIDNPYTSRGLYTIFASGFLPTPYLWGETEELKYSTLWKTKLINGSMKLVDDNNKVISSAELVRRASFYVKEIKGRTLK